MELKQNITIDKLTFMNNQNLIQDITTIKELTLENLQNWVDKVSPVKVDLTKEIPHTALPTVGRGEAGQTRTFLNNQECKVTLNFYWFRTPNIEVRFNYLNKITNESIKESNWFKSYS